MRKLFFVLLAITATACVDEHNHPDLTTGEQLYQHHCADCHGDQGQGIFLKGAPPHNDIELSSNEVIVQIKGNDNRMPRFEEMPDNEAMKLAYYVNGLKN